MKSVSGKKWIEQAVNKNSIEKLKQDFGFNEILSRLIVIRKFDITEINNINNNLDVINVFKDNYDFNNASEIIIDTINKNEKIGILGDYDVDGSAATSLLVRFLKYINHPHFFYIPDRKKDGYGATKVLFQKLILKKPKLIIMLDCGSSSNIAIDFLNKNNIKSIIIDHHEINKPFPKANAIINPKMNNGYVKFDYFCATALTYFFLDILIKKTASSFKLSNFLIYVLLANICDVMPLRKINKIIASNVLRDFRLKDNFAINFIFNQLGINKKLTIDDLGYLIGPIINSGGRLGYSNYGTELLSSDNPIIIKKNSINLIKLNERRKRIEKNILNEINFKKIKKENKNIIVYYNSKINEGLIGIIAARLTEYFNKPSFVLTDSNKIIKGSARSTPYYNIGNLMKLLIDKRIIISGGGHNMAAGFTIKKKNIQILNNFIQKNYTYNTSTINSDNNYDAEISPLAINKDFINEINKIGPFGNNNFLPTFLIRNLKIIKVNILNNKHISLILKPKVGPSIKSICFNSVNTDIGDYLLSYKNKIDVIGKISENIWNNKKTIQLNIVDII